ncbi:MAG: 30S ribosomal protein S17 [Deltaproteobacteria bacterium]|nr:30S ribosomal protein S17 [Deltaproteobacteria bacterium]
MGRGKVKTRVGTVLSNKMDQTVIVDVSRVVIHPKYQKPIKRNTRFKAHDQNNQCKIGDKVLIIESRPISKTKRWRVSKILESPTIVEGEISEEVSGEGVLIQ